MTKQEVKQKVFWTLWIGSVFATFAAIPYKAASSGSVDLLALSPPFNLVADLILFAAVYAILIHVGLLLAKPAGLGTPALDKMVEGKPIKPIFAPFLTNSILLGFITAVSVLVLQLLFVVFLDVPVLQNAMDASLADRLFALFFGAINEEIFYRLFLMTLIVWGLVKARGEKMLADWQMWTVISGVALIDAAFRLPLIFEVVDFSPLITVYVLLTGAISGIVFGMMYWKNGLVSAMITHFVFELSLFIILPAIVTIS